MIFAIAACALVALVIGLAGIGIFRDYDVEMTFIRQP